jgi:CelD/BcsL family acetyltransferase involved in cellulose biosynthesis
VGRIEERRIDFKVGYANLFRSRVRVLTFVHEGLLGDPSMDDCRAFVSSIRESLRTGEAHMAFLSHIRTDSPLLHVVDECLSGLEGPIFTAPQLHRIAAVDHGRNGLYDHVLPKIRKTQRRWKKLLQDFAGAVRIDRFSEASDLDEVIRDVEEVAKKTYQRGLGVGFIANPETRELLKLAARKNWLWGRILYIAERPIAFWIGNVYQGTLHGDFVGYDPAFSAYSPGMFLMVKTVEDLVNHIAEYGIRRVDFGLGDASYKDVFGTSGWEEMSGYIFARTLRGGALMAMTAMTGRLDRGIRAALDAGGLLPKVKKAWRKLATRSNGTSAKTPADTQ